MLLAWVTPPSTKKTAELDGWRPGVAAGHFDML